MKTTVIYHSADYDGIFCREIARKFLSDAELLGWNFGDPLIPFPAEGKVYVLDLSPECLIPAIPAPPATDCLSRMIWIDHHKTSMEKWSSQIPGYRIDGVAACRLAWQWFMHCALPDHDGNELPFKQDFVDRKVSEPMAVRLAGEYDIWDKRDADAELFQHGLRSRELTPEVWRFLLTQTADRENVTVLELLEAGQSLQYARTHENESIIKELGFTLQWEGLTFLACNAARYNSFLFTAGLKPEHDACYGFKWTGNKWSVSLYHAIGKENIDLSAIAVKHGGGGHRGACGFTTSTLPFVGVTGEQQSDKVVVR